MTDFTGSTLIGFLPAMKKSLLPSGTYAVGVRMGYSFSNPNEAISCTTGSDIIIVSETENSISAIL